MTGDGRSTQIVVLSAIAALIVVLCGLVLIGIDRNRSAILEAVGVATTPPPDARLANARLIPGDLQRVFGDPANYPDDARDRGEQGKTSATLTIASTGKVDNCIVTDSSGSASLDAATCRIARRDVRFVPARDRAGRVIPSTFVLRVRWQLPEEG